MFFNTLALLAKRLPWDAIEARITPLLSRKNRPGYSQQLLDLFASHQQLVVAGASVAGHKRLPVRLMVSLLYLKYTYNESDEGLCQRWSQDAYFQFLVTLKILNQGHLVTPHISHGPPNPYDGHTLNEQLEQSTILM